MAKNKSICEMISWGIYEGWDKSSKSLPKLIVHETNIPARLGIEFGYILNIKKAKGKKVYFCIDHPPFKDASGEISPPFTGELYVKNNDWDFYLGDTLWDPIDDKVGEWRLITELEGVVIADKTFNIQFDFKKDCH